MTLTVVPFRIGHLDMLAEQPGTAYLRPYIDRKRLKELEDQQSFSGFWGDRMVVSSGVVEQWEGRGEAWAFLAADMGRAPLLAVHKAVKRYLDVCPFRRVEAVVDCDFHNAHQWVKMLGFQLEAERLRGYRPDGGDCSLYALVK